jgi:hypothetical protein
MRICLSLIDLAAPYVNIVSAKRSDDSSAVDINWKVGGAVSVDNNLLVWVELDNENSLDNNEMFEKVEGKD